MPVSELDVLKPIDPSITDSDDYEIFTLTNAQVVFERSRKPASLLVAYADTPLTVTGRLEAPDRSQLKALVKRPFKPVDVVVTGVTRFSYGQTEGGDIVLWALGEAGWFELSPSREWRELWREGVEAVGCLYFVTDIYNEPRKRGGGPNAQLIFQEYVEDDRYECNDPTEAAAIFQKHRTFLIMCFLNRAQGIGWSNTPLYQYYKRHFATDFDIVRARIGGRAVEEEKPSRASAPPRSKGPRVLKKGDEPPKKDENWWESAAIFEFIQKAVNHSAMHIGHVTLDRTAKLLTKRYEIEEIQTAKNVLLVHATNLCYMMDHPRRKNIQFFAGEPIYQELSAGHNLSAADMRRAQSIELRPRKDHASLKEEALSESDSSSTLATPPRRPPRKKRERLSVLRPKSSKYSGKGKSVTHGEGKGKGKGKGKAPKNVNTDSESGDEKTSESESDVDMDTPTQALSPGKRKRVPEVVEVNPRKRAASTPLEPQPQSPPSSSEEDDSTTPTESLPLRWRSNHDTKASSPALLPPILSTPLPQYTANAPGDAWICTFDGCAQKVYAASSDLGRRLIKDHLEDHARGRMKEIGILLSEEQKLRLPVK
jgi:hypothetical protein